MKCLVLGGGGFIGSAVTDRLLLDGHLVRVLARPKLVPYRSFGPKEPMEWMRGDFLNVHDLRKAVQGIDVVFHLVSTTVPKSANDDPIWDVQSNLVGSLQLLQVLREQSVGKIIFISSGGDGLWSTPIPAHQRRAPYQPHYGLWHYQTRHRKASADAHPSPRCAVLDPARVESLWWKAAHRDGPGSCGCLSPPSTGGSAH